MRNKFSELIEQGVAKFNYTPVAPQIPEQDFICRQYNNIFSIPTDTHMHYNAETGERYITGHMIANKDKWDMFKYSSNWGAVNFRSTGYWCLYSFLQNYGLCGSYTTINGDVAYLVISKPEETQFPCPNCPACCTTTESKVPQNIGMLTLNGDVMKIRECYKDKKDLYEVSVALNENIYVKGNEWTVVDDKLMCPIGNKVYIL